MAAPTSCRPLSTAMVVSEEGVGVKAYPRLSVQSQDLGSGGLNVFLDNNKGLSTWRRGLKGLKPGFRRLTTESPAGTSGPEAFSLPRLRLLLVFTRRPPCVVGTFQLSMQTSKPPWLVSPAPLVLPELTLTSLPAAGRSG